MGGDKLDEKTIELMREMHKKGHNCKEIAEKFGVGHSTAWFYVSKKTAGFKKYGEYQDSLARERGFDSYGHYRKVARGEVRSSTAEERREFAEERGFKTYNEFLNDWAEGHGYDSYSHYQITLTKKKGRQHYLDRKEQEILRRESPRNKRMSAFIQERLKDLGKTQQWLAMQLEVTKQTISNIVSRRYMLGKNKLDRFCEAMSISRNRLEKILNQ